MILLCSKGFNVTIFHLEPTLNHFYCSILFNTVQNCSYFYNIRFFFVIFSY
nr:MAG TPA: hypothetical protein [Caudoviricetes sp.]